MHIRRARASGKRATFGAMVAASAVLAAGAVLAGCGGGGQPAVTGGTTQSGTGTPDTFLTTMIRCYRTHGDPGYPDPVYDPSDGRWHFPNATVPAATLQACRRLIPAPNVSPPVPQAAFQQLVRLAECLRQHGVTGWPDPDPDGSFGLPPSISPKDPAYNHAFQVCQPYMPNGGRIDVHNVP